jgi:hypothetical protein
MTEKAIIKNRFLFILIVLIASAILMPSQFRKGGIDSNLLNSIPISVLILGYLYILPIKSLALAEKILMPLILSAVIYSVVTILTYGILNRVFDDYNMEVEKTVSTKFFVNLLYFSSMVFPLVGLIKVYHLFRVQR